MQKRLYHKNFTILVLGQMISLFGSAIQRFALSLYLLDLTGSASLFASMLAISMVPIVLLSPVAGILADRGNKKRLMIALDVMSGLLLMFYALILLQGKDHVIIIGAVMVLLSAIATIYQPVVNTCIPLIIDEEQLIRANAIIQQVSSLSHFLGPILAGVLYGVFGIKGVICINMVSFLGSAVLEGFLKIPKISKARTDSLKELFVGDMKESYTYLRYKNPIIFRMLLFSGLYNLFLVPVFSVATPYVIKETLGLSSQMYGLAEGMIALGMILGGGLITWKPELFHIKRVYRLLYLTTLAMFAMGGAMALFNFGKSSAHISVGILTVAGMLIMGVLGIANVLSASYLYKETEQVLLGKVLAFGSAFATLCIPLGQILFGGLIEVYAQSVHWIIYSVALAVFGVTLLVRWNVKQIK
ncbi:MAG: MFS transporter [Cellulosilyticaceae bacterium]